jgi:hypothetical protein
VLRRLGVDAMVTDDDTLDCRHDSIAQPLSKLLAALLDAGLAIEAAGFHPPWPAQLFGAIETDK